MPKSYSTITFPMSDTDPAGLEEGLIPEEITTDSNGNVLSKKYIGLEALKFNLRNILLTIPGEKLSDPNFGVGVQRYLFDLETQDWSSVRSKVESQIRTYILSEGYIDRFKVKLNVRAEYNAVQVVIDYIPTSTKELEQLVIEVS
tara:strand:+ start:159 stop:593 length:435 start_codon:yes stop_codon:yes gene_type:complete